MRLILQRVNTQTIFMSDQKKIVVVKVKDKKTGITINWFETVISRTMANLWTYLPSAADSSPPPRIQQTIPRPLKLAMRNDEELLKVLSGINIAKKTDGLTDIRSGWTCNTQTGGR